MPLPPLFPLLREYADAAATLGFVLAAALLALLLAPQPMEFAAGDDYWYELLLTEPDYSESYPATYVPSTQTLALLPSPEPEEDAEPAAEPESWEMYTIKRRDTLGDILRKINADEEAYTYLVTLRNMRTYSKLHPRKQIAYRIDDDGKLVALRYKLSPELHLNFVRNSDGSMHAAEEAPALVSRAASGVATITPEAPSIYQAFAAAGIPDLIINEVADVLETRVDFIRQIRNGDSIAIHYERLYDSDGAYAGSGKLYGVRLINQGRRLVGLLNPADGNYYTENGENTQRAFLLSPLKFTRISSRYSLRRFHPVLKKWRAHRGVDFAAKTGTPIRATGDGIVDFVGTNGGYGRTVRIKHFSGKYTTLYAHMSRYAKGMRKGVPVLQGDVIGYVGSSGLSTGPHLHYEFRIDGKHVDPLSAKVPVVKPPLTAEQIAAFQQATRETQRLLEVEVAAAAL